MSPKMSEEFIVSILVYRDDGDCFALAIEMDVRGYGDTPDAAVKDLDAMLLAQINFALQMGHPESVWKPAEEKFWRMYEEARRQHLVSQLGGTKPSKSAPTATLHPLPSPVSGGRAWSVASA